MTMSLSLEQGGSLAAAGGATRTPATPSDLHRSAPAISGNAGAKRESEFQFVACCRAATASEKAFCENEVTAPSKAATSRA